MKLISPNLNRIVLKISILIILFLLQKINAYSQSDLKKLTIRVLNEKQHQLKQVQIRILNTDKNFFTNSKGLYETYLSPKLYTAVLHNITYINDTIRFELNSDTLVQVVLRKKKNEVKPKSKHQENQRIFFSSKDVFELDSVNVLGFKGDKMNLSAPIMEYIGKEKVEKLPSFIGEKDVVKILQLLPGVQAQSEGSTEYSVRGGKPDQNLFLLDGMSLYSISHLFGMVSTFNPLMVESVKLYKADAPANFGGRVSSILEAKSIEPSTTHKTKTIEMGFLSSKLNLSYPLLKNKLGLSFGIRYSLFFDLPYRFQIIKTGFNFTDVNLSLFYQLNQKNKIQFIVFSSSDGILSRTDKNETDLNSNFNVFKSQTILVTDFKSVWNKNFNSSVKFGISTFSNRLEENDIKNQTIRKFKGIINDLLVYPQVKYFNDSLTLNLGAESIWHRSFPVNYLEIKSNHTQTVHRSAQPILSFSPFISGVYSTNRWRFDLGLRNANYYTPHRKYIYIEPRISIAKQLDINRKLIFSYGKFSQGLHRLVNSGLGFPFDIIYPANKDIQPQVSQNFNLNYLYSFNYLKKRYTLIISPYYRRIFHSISYLDGYDSNSLLGGELLNANDASTILTSGNTNIKGIDVQLEKNTGHLTGWLSYSYLKATGIYPKLNNGKRFPEDYDRTHQINLVGIYQFNKRTSISATWSYLRGRPITFPTNAILQVPISPNANFLPAPLIHIPTERNSLRMIPFHRLDVSANFKNQWFHRESELSIGIFNVYNRANPNFYYIKSSGNSQELVSASFFHILPTFSLKIYLDKKVK